MLDRVSIFLGMGIFLLAVSGLEYFMSPPAVYNLSSVSNIGNAQNEIKQDLTSSFPMEAFQKAHIGIVLKERSFESPTIFNGVFLNEQSLNMRVLKTRFIKREDNELISFLTVYEFFSEENLTANSGYEKIKNFLIKQYEGDIESDINETNTYGEHSFYGNLGKEKKTVYLIVASKNNIFGFEYPKSYHEDMKKIYKVLFDGQ